MAELNAFIVSVLIGVAIFSVILLLAVLSYDSQIKNEKYELKNNRRRKIHRDSNEWLFSDFYLKIYDLLFYGKRPEDVAQTLGVNVKDYLKNCDVMREKPQLKKVIIYKFYGFAIAIAFFIIAALWSPIVIPFGVGGLYYFGFYEETKMKSKANAKKMAIQNDLLRFLDLLSPILSIHLPIETAIFTLSKNLEGCVLADEFLITLNEMKLTARNWSEVLESMAEKYEIQEFSDFVLDITTSYDKGVSVADAVVEKAKDIRINHLTDVKERAGRAGNTILIPVALLQLAPMIAFLMLPIVAEMGSF